MRDVAEYVGIDNRSHRASFRYTIVYVQRPHPWMEVLRCAHDCMIRQDEKRVCARELIIMAIDDILAGITGWILR